MPLHASVPSSPFLFCPFCIALHVLLYISACIIFVWGQLTDIDPLSVSQFTSLPAYFSKSHTIKANPKLDFEGFFNNCLSCSALPSSLVAPLLPTSPQTCPIALKHLQFDLLCFFLMFILVMASPNFTCCSLNMYLYMFN